MAQIPTRGLELRKPDQTWLLVAASIGTYLLILTGVSNALAGTTAVCSSWPLCHGPWLQFPETVLVLGHRLTALLVGLVLVAATGTVLKDSKSGPVQWAVGIAAILYPIQVVLGARVAVAGGSTAVEVVHLVTAMTIFTALMAALIWDLEDHTPVEADDPQQTEKAPFLPASEISAIDNGPPSRSLSTLVRAYVRLTKPYLWWLLSLVALAGMGLAAGGVPPVGTTVATLTGGILAIGASATFNNVYERDRDRLMQRTNDRPIVTDIIPPGRALAFGFALLLASMIVFVAFVNVLAAGLGLLAVLFYSVVYTVLLKPHTDQNTVIGGAVGALPALIGWAAVTDTIGVPAIALGIVVFLWTPAHFYNLALLHKEDYARAGFPMLPVVRGDRTTRRHIAAFLGATMLGAVLLGTTSGLGPLYAATAVVFGGLFLIATVHLNRIGTNRAAKRTFAAANAYLGALLFAIVLDSMLI